MRTGAIFARGSCRALKWMALFGVVFALGAGQAAAQTITAAKATVTEGGNVAISVEVEASIQPDTVATPVTVTVALEDKGQSATPSGATAPVTSNDESPDANLNLGATFSVTLAANTNPSGGDPVTRKASSTVTLQTTQDDDAENETVLLNVNATTTPGVGANLIFQESHQVVTITDDDPQNYTVALTSTTPAQSPTEGTSFTVDVKADPPHVDLTETLAVQLRTPAGAGVYTIEATGGVNPATTPLGMGASGDNANSHMLTITPPMNDGNRVADTIMVELYSGSTGNSDLENDPPFTQDVLDLHTLPAITAVMTDKDGKELDPQPAMVSEGDTIYLTFTAERPTTAKPAISDEGVKATVSLSGSADGDDFDPRLPQEIDIPGGPAATTAKLELKVADNVDVNDEMFTLDAEVKGDATKGTATSMSTDILGMAVMIDDTTMLHIEPQDPADVETAVMEARTAAAMSQTPADLWTAAGATPDDDAVIMLGALFKLPDAMSGLSLSVTADSDNPDAVTAEADSSMVTLSPKGDGMANVEVVVTTFSTATTSQQTQNTATVEFMVSVDKLPPVVTVTTMPTGSVDEGGMFDVIATLNQDAPYDKAITLEVRGPVVGGADHMVTIDEGMTYGTVTLEVMDDMVVAPMSDIVVIPSFPPDPDVTVEPSSIVLMVTEDDVATTFEVTVAADSVMEGGEVEIDVTATPAVTEETMIDLVLGAGSAGAEDYAVESLMIASGGTTGGATLTAAADGMVEGDETLMLNAMVGDLLVGTVSLTIVDGDMEIVYEYGLTVSPATVAEGGEVTITATVDPAVEEATTVTLMRDAASTAAMSDYDVAASITIAAGGTSGEATLMATADDLVEDDEMVTLHGMVDDMRIGSVSVTIESDDVDVVYEYGLTVSPATVAEGGEVTITATVDPAVEEATTVTLMRDAASTAAMSDYDVAASITIAAGGTSGEATLMATADDLVEDDEMVTLHGMVGDMRIGSVSVTIESDDVDVVYSYELSAPATATEGDEVVITATADPAVEEATTVMLARDASSTLAPDQYTGEMSITIAAGMATGTTTLTITEDYDVEGDATLSLVGTVGTASAGVVSIAVSDNDVETTYSLMVTDNLVPVMSLTEGDDPVTVTVTASQMVREATMVKVVAGMGSEADAGDFTVTDITIPANDTAGVGVLTISDDLDVEGSETLALVAMVGDMMSEPVMITIEDNDVATTFSLMAAASSVMEGGDVTITATATQDVRGNVEIGLVRDGSSTARMDDDFTLTQGGMITIMDGESEGSLTLMAVDDEDVEGTESVTFNGTMDSGSVTIEIMDNDEETVYTYSLSAPASATEGDEVTITATASSAVEADTMVMLTRDASSTLAADQYTGGMSITIEAGMETGATTLMITEDYAVEADATLMLSGSVGAMSAGSVSIMVTDNDMETTYTLEITDNTVPVTSLTEGDGAVTVTVTASQMVREATMVQVVAAANSQADASDFMASAINIAAGGTTGVGTLTITDDPDVEGTEVLSLVAMVGDAMSAPVMITVMDNDTETTYSVSASASTVMEGGEVTITATATQPVRGNKEVMLVRDGSSMAMEDATTTRSACR